MRNLAIIYILITVLIAGCAQKSKEEIFWDWFVENNSIYFDNASKMNPKSELANKLSVRLKSVHPDLVWVIGQPENTANRELIISADGLKEVFPAVLKLTQVAPQISRWKIKAFRQRVPGKDLGIRMEDFSISYNDIYFHHVSENNLIGLELYIKEYTGESMQQNAVFVLMDALLGEYDSETTINWIEWNKLENKDTTNLLPFPELRNLVDKIKE